MNITFNVLRFKFVQLVNDTPQIRQVPTRDIWDFTFDGSSFTFSFDGDSNPAFTFTYASIVLYQGHENIPTYDTVVSDIQAALLASDTVNAGGIYQRFVATASQVTFIVTDFTPSIYGLVLVDDMPNMENWELSGNVYTFAPGLSLGSVVLIYQGHAV